jgi:LAO/AO transport system kinase
MALTTGADASADVIDQLISVCGSGDPSVVARLLSYVSRGTVAQAAQISRALGPDVRSSTVVVGVTGPPGVGKSTLTSALITAYRRRGSRVGVLAVDPSSPISGGAVLGDRIRMGAHSRDEAVFVRSLASRGDLGGLVHSAALAVRVMAACNYDVAIIETVGVGQSEADIVHVADSIVLTLAPGAGDAIQAQKAGILEIADILVINKADLAGADSTARDLREMLLLSQADERAWRPPIIKTVASSELGVDDLVAALDRHWESARVSAKRPARDACRRRYEALAIVKSAVRAHLADLEGMVGVEDCDPQGAPDPYEAADATVRALGRRLLGGLEGRGLDGSWENH